MYCCKINDLFLPSFFRLLILARTYSAFDVQLMPWPLFENSPGFIIQ